jgi:hypothetical protein
MRKGEYLCWRMMLAQDGRVQLTSRGYERNKKPNYPAFQHCDRLFLLSHENQTVQTIHPHSNKQLDHR